MAFFALLCVLFFANVLCYPGGNYSPIANSEALVVNGTVRFTVLTERIIRIEYSPRRQFEDSATLVAINRKLPVPKYDVAYTSDGMTIKTRFIELTYSGKGVDAPSVANTIARISYLNELFTWYPGKYDSGNLFGTIRTLDHQSEPTNLNCTTNPSSADLHCTDGLISQSGWTVVNDTNSVLITESDLPWLVGRNSTDEMDIYLLGFGRDYLSALKEFKLIAGPVPIPPKYIFGLTYSRWWPYGNTEHRELIEEFELNGVPLDSLVLDMDWHLTFYKEANRGDKDQAGEAVGWTGFTFDTRRYPNPNRFLKWLSDKGLKATMNIHPAAGIQPHEAVYEEFARAVGIDPATKVYSPYNLTDEFWANTFHKIVMNPLEDIGVDFWWLDWQQWMTGSPNPTIWLNHDFFLTNNRRNSDKRKLILHRFGGLGSHRYPVGFSGDVNPNWSTLNDQPYFTATSANVLFGYWSHDLGGFFASDSADYPEMYARWLQWGMFSPICRMHSTRDERERRIWKYDYKYSTVMKNALRQRLEMLPYIYSQAYETHQTGIAYLHPLYYEFPELPEAYSFKNEYFFGKDFIVHPVTSPMDYVTELTTQQIFIPEGTWVEFRTGEPFVGPQTITRTYALSEVPSFVRAGTIIPLLTLSNALLGKAQQEYTDLVYTVYVGGSKETRSSFLYEDSGKDESYLKDEFLITNMTYSVTNNKQITLNIKPWAETKGYSTHTKTRKNYFRIVGVSPAVSVTVNKKSLTKVLFTQSNEKPHMTPDTFAYDGSTLAVVFALSEQDSTAEIAVTIELENPIEQIGHYYRCIQRLNTVKKRLDLYNSVIYDEDYGVLLDTAETGERISQNPNSQKSELQQFYKNVTETYTVLSSLQNIPNDVLRYLQQQIKTC